MICPFTRFDYSNGQVRRSLLIKNSSKVNVLARREEIGKEELGNIEIKIPKGTKKKEKEKKRGHRTSEFNLNTHAHTYPFSCEIMKKKKK